MMLARRGWFGFARDRVIRIAGPLAAFWFPVMAGIVTALVWNAQANGLVTPGAPPPPPPTYDWTNFPLTHLWFLYVLMIFYVALLVLRAPFAAMDRNGAWGRLVDRVTGALTGPHTPVLLAAPWRSPCGWTRNGSPSSPCRRRMRASCPTPPPWSGSAWPLASAPCWTGAATC